MTDIDLIIKKIEADLPFPTQETLIFNDTYIFLVYEEKGKLRQNIFAFNTNGEFKWQISNSIIEKHAFNSKSAVFVHIHLGDNDELVAYNFDGWKVGIDPNNGNELWYEFTK